MVQVEHLDSSTQKDLGLLADVFPELAPLTTLELTLIDTIGIISREILPDERAQKYELLIQMRLQQIYEIEAESFLQRILKRNTRITVTSELQGLALVLELMEDPGAGQITRGLISQAYLGAIFERRRKRKEFFSLPITGMSLLYRSLISFFKNSDLEDFNV